MAFRSSPFDYTLQLTEDDLEEIGAAIAFYTLGCYADQPNIDLPGRIWSENLRNALPYNDKMLTPMQIKRRNRLLGFLYEVG